LICQSSISSDTSFKPLDTLPIRQSAYSIEIINSTDSTYGYIIKNNGKDLIYQPHIPGLAGNKGFESKELAKKCADMVVMKLQSFIMPPSISIEELQELGIIVDD